MRPLTRVRGGRWSPGALEDAGDVEGQGAVGVDRFELAGAEVADRFVADGVPVGLLAHRYGARKSRYIGSVKARLQAAWAATLVNLNPIARHLATQTA